MSRRNRTIGSRPLVAFNAVQLHACWIGLTMPVSRTTPSCSVARAQASGMPLTRVVGIWSSAAPGCCGRGWTRVPRNEVLWVGTGPWAVAAIHVPLAETDWRWLSAGAGNRGEHGYDWQCLVLMEAEAVAWGHYRLFRRAPADQVGQAGDGAGRLRSTQRHRLVPARHAGPAERGAGHGPSAAGAGLVLLHRRQWVAQN